MIRGDELLERLFVTPKESFDSFSIRIVRLAHAKVLELPGCRRRQARNANCDDNPDLDLRLGDWWPPRPNGQRAHFAHRTSRRNPPRNFLAIGVNFVRRHASAAFRMISPCVG